MRWHERKRGREERRCRKGRRMDATRVEGIVFKTKINSLATVVCGYKEFMGRTKLIEKTNSCSIN